MELGSEGARHADAPASLLRRQRLLPALPLLLAVALWPWQITDYPNHTGDTAEFQFVAKVFGIPHPPGSPHYIAAVWLCGRVISCASPALVANAFSYLCGVGLVALFIRLMIRWGLGYVSTAAGALMLVASPLLSRLATVAEIYVPGLCCLVLAMERVEAWKSSGRPRQLLTAAAAAAVATGIYAGTLIMLPVLGAQIWTAQRPFLKNRSGWGAILVYCVLVAGAYLGQIPRMLDPDTPYRWARVKTADDVVRYFTTAGFRQSFTLAPAQESLGRRAAIYVEKTMKETIWLPALLAVAALLARPGGIWRRSVLVPALLLVINLVFICTYDVWDVWEFLLPGVIATVLLAARVLDRLLHPQDSAAWRRKLGRGMAALVLFASLVHVAVSQDDVRARVLDRSATETATNRLKAMEPNSLVFSPFWDDSAFLWYHLFRADTPWPDVMLAHALPASVVVSYLEKGREFILPNEERIVKAGRPVYVIGDALAAEVAAAGLRSEEVLGGMYRIDAP